MRITAQSFEKNILSGGRPEPLRKLSFSSCEQTGERRKATERCLIFALAFFTFASAVWAQPAMSRGEQLLPISYEECIRRANQAYAQEGWANIGNGGAYVNAFKDNHEAYIMCNVAPDNKIWVNIVVASTTTNDSGVPGAERVKLQNRMNQSGSSGAVSGKWRMTSVTPAGQPYPGSYTVEMNLTEKNGSLSGVGTWFNGVQSNFTGEIRNGEVVLYRTDPSGFRGVFRGGVMADGSWAGTGENDPSSPGGNAASYSWTAIRQP